MRPHHLAHVCGRDDPEAGSTQIAAFGAVNAEHRTTKHAAQKRRIYARLSTGLASAADRVSTPTVSSLRLSALAADLAR